MSIVTGPPATGTKPSHTPRVKSRTSLLAHGLPMVWLTGGALAICLFMIAGLLFLVLWQGMATFWPVPAVEVALLDGKTRYLGEVVRTETYHPAAGAFEVVPAAKRAEARAAVERK